MGLLDRVSESGLVQEKPAPVAVDIPPVKKSNSVGLLKKSLDIADSKNRLDFFEFINKYDLPLCASFSCNKDIYCIEESFGLDGESICLSISTQDFWAGINQNSVKDPLPFYQFFSKKLKDSIENLKVYKKSDGRIFLFSSPDNFGSFIYSDIEKIKKSDITFNKKIPENLITIDYSEAIESLVISYSKSNENERLIKALSNELYYNLLKYFPQPDKLYYFDTGIFKLDFYHASDLPLDLLSNHLRYMSEFILGEHSQLMSVKAEDN